MRGRPIVLVTLLLAACGGSAKGGTTMPTTAVWDDAATQEVKAQVEQTMNAFAAMDLAGFEAGVTEDVTSYEMDLEGKPIRLGSRAEALKFAGEIFAMMKQMGATLKVDIHAIDCRATTTVGYCVVEFDFIAAMPDGSQMKQPSRNTVTLRKSDDGWKWTHWHSSLSVAAAPH